MEVEENGEREKISCGWTMIKLVLFFNLMVKKKLSHGGKGFTFPMLNVTQKMGSPSFYSKSQ